MPLASASAKKLPTRISDTRLEIVIVRRSEDAANAIIAGKRTNRIASATMNHSILRTSRGHCGACNGGNPRMTLVADRLAPVAPARRPPAEAGGREKVLPGGTRCAHLPAAYFSALDTDVKVAFRLVPTVWTTVTIATEMPAAISPYSIAVAPDSLRTNCIIFDICSLLRVLRYLPALR